MDGFINGEELSAEEMIRMREDGTPGIGIIFDQKEAGKFLDFLASQTETHEHSLQEQRNTGTWKGV